MIDVELKSVVLEVVNGRPTESQPPVFDLAAHGVTSSLIASQHLFQSDWQEDGFPPFVQHAPCVINAYSCIVLIERGSKVFELREHLADVGTRVLHEVLPGCEPQRVGASLL